VSSSARRTSYTVDADLSPLMLPDGIGTMWQFDATHNDDEVHGPPLNNGHVTFTIPATAAILIAF
jgi:hypothetical protein